MKMILAPMLAAVSVPASAVEWKMDEARCTLMAVPNLEVMMSYEANASVIIIQLNGRQAGLTYDDLPYHEAELQVDYGGGNYNLIKGKLRKGGFPESLILIIPTRELKTLRGAEELLISDPREGRGGLSSVQDVRGLDPHLDRIRACGEDK